MIYGQKNTPPPVQKPLQDEPPKRDKLELMLLNANKNQDSESLIDLARGLIERFKLPFTVEQADGKTEVGGVVRSAGWYYLKDTLSKGELHLNSFITLDPETIAMKEDARKCAHSEHDVLIVGETGTGKEIIAKAMIGAREGPIKAVNCAGFPSTLIESELFGYTKGSFTGAEKDKKGLMQEAQDGVMFLDEIGELEMSVQAKLLRALQEKRVRRVGASVDEVINCKFVCATHRDLKKMVKEGQFRRDLYARISTLELHIKPLKERMCDVEAIVLSLKGGKEFLSKHGEDLRQGLLDLSLNVRSLQQYVIRYNVLGRVLS